ncbi:PREDICTED: uncharacterized protein LOC104587546 isoform X2 [Nelumbo nucifera]|nr:PREDICTED: uncharacterized protein LOC104587546 isoform X2 [Nelumbo nucifera]XP_010243502.1 PREDICTED: uncharacterized protein LOC104587546 isoform X2 [Nelumbo nucifera]
MTNGGVNNDSLSSNGEKENLGTQSTLRQSTDKDASLATCRVCQCVESDRMGDAALGFLDITPPLREVSQLNVDSNSNNKRDLKCAESEINKNCGRKSGFIEFVSPDGEVFICDTDLEAGSYYHQDALIELGCSCKNDLALAHYACALKWFINHGSTVCEICGSTAKSIRPTDFKKVVASLKEYETLRERTATGVPTTSHIQTDAGVDPDAVAAIRRQRLSEISLWFNPHNNNHPTVPQGAPEQVSNFPTEDVVPNENPATKWAVEGTGILVATGLLTVTLAWLIAPRVGKKTAKSGLHILLGGICALTVVIFLRFIILSRIKYGPARYWAILFVFWFLVFGIWASRTHGTHST